MPWLSKSKRRQKYAIRSGFEGKFVLRGRNMRDENRGELIDKEVDVLRDAHAALSKSIAAVAAAREKVAAVEAALGAADSAGAAKGGVPYKELLDTLKWRGIQVYWNGTMVGHDIRKFLASFEEILARIAAKIASIQRTEKAEGVLQRHTRF